tara:strand:- start:1318 stop:1569 length:252 start_codon:yes stop_codon:yes gene_type:complete
MSTENNFISTKVVLDDAILRSRTGAYIVNVLLSADLLLNLYKEGKTPSKERVELMDKLIREIESNRIKALRKMKKFQYLDINK